MQGHTKVSYVHYGFALFLAILGVAMAVTYGMAGPDDGVREGLGAGIAILLPLSVVHFATARGAARRAGWARVASKCIACVLLVGFPIGTLIGIYLLLNGDWSSPRSDLASLADGWPTGPTGLRTHDAGDRQPG